MSLITILLTLAIVGVLVYVIIQLPMPPAFKNVIVAVAILFVLWGIMKQFGLDIRI